MLQFPQYWLGGRSEGVAGGLGDYSLNETAARANRFARLPQIPNTGLDGIAHAFHFDAVLYAAYLRKIAEHAGVKRTERSEEHTSELQSLMRISYAVFCLKKKNILIKRSNHEDNTQKNRDTK